MNKKVPLGTVIGIIIIIVAITFTATMGVSWKLYNNTLSENTNLKTAISKLGETDQLVRQYSLENIDETALNDAIISGYISGIGDKYAYYTSAGMSESSNNSKNGLATGIGISYVVDPGNKLPCITLVHSGTSADTSGLKVGDYIIQTPAGKTESVGADAAMQSLVGKDGETKALTVLRNGQTVNVVCTVSQYETTSVYGYVRGSIGVIRILSFNNLSVQQFKNTLQSLYDQNVTGIVFDIRHNEGGILSVAKDIVDIILPEGTIYTAEYTNGEVETYASDASSVTLPMVLLIDSKTASAAEMFAAAIKDHYAGPLVGMTTFGKGVTQRTYTLSDDSMITITVANLLSPKGNNYNEVGIEPTYTVALSVKTDEEFYLIDFNEDIQLQTAIGILNNQ
ncbi:MAG: hypothetical protein IJ462_01550 [Clostridia bacterium]|nr:hypothetical protein [Clostridia bacterium]